MHRTRQEITRKKFTVAKETEISAELPEAEWEYRYNRDIGYDKHALRNLPPILQKTVTLATTFDPDERMKRMELDSPTSPADDPSAANAVAQLSPSQYPARDKYFQQAVHYHRSIDMLEDELMAMKGSPDQAAEWSPSEKWLLDNAIGPMAMNTAIALNVDNVVKYDLGQMWTEHTTKDLMQGSFGRVRLRQADSIQDESAVYNEELREKEREDRTRASASKLAEIIRPFRDKSVEHFNKCKEIVLEENKKQARRAEEDLFRRETEYVREARKQFFERQVVIERELQARAWVWQTEIAKQYQKMQRQAFQSVL